jgi:plastocyanin
MEASNVRSNRIIAGAMVVAIGVGSAALASGAPARPAATYKLSASKSALKFNVTKITAKAGKVTLSMANPASFKHAVAIKGHGTGKTVGKGGTSTVTATLKKGTYTFYCPVPGHEAAGMKGTLVVK